jgi:putative sigma-54 modulation protein
MVMTRKEKAAEFVQEGYQINITGRNVIITDALRNYVYDKVSKIERFTDRIINVNVILEVQRADQKCEITMKVNNLKIMSRANSTDMYATIDLAVNKLQRQLLKYKRRLNEHHARNVATVDLNVNVLAPHREDDLKDINEDIEELNEQEAVESYRPHQIVSQETLPMKSLTYDEAIMKMELSGDAFLIFRSEVDHKIKVIYRRNDGNYGVIEPEA